MKTPLSGTGNGDRIGDEGNDDFCAVSDSSTVMDEHCRSKTATSPSSLSSSRSPRSNKTNAKISTTTSSRGYASGTRSTTKTNIIRKTTPERVTTTATETDSDEEIFDDYSALGKRIGKTLYYGGRLPTTPRPSFPLTILAVNAFTSGTLKMEMDTLDFLDLDMASEIGRNACVSPTAVMMALVYLERLYKNNPKYLASCKPSELFVVALLVASKFEQDDGEQYSVFNSDWVKTVGFDKQHLNQLEIKFLCAIDWNVKVDLDEYLSTLNKVELSLSCQESQRRNWMTYTDITAISNVFLPWELLWPILYTYVFQVVTIAFIGYATLVATLLTSSTLTPEVVALSQTLLSSVSFSPAQFTLPTHTQMDLTHKGNMSKPPACLLSESLLQQVLLSLAETETENSDSSNRQNSTDYAFGDKQLEQTLTGFHSAVNQGRGTIIHRHNHLYTIA